MSELMGLLGMGMAFLAGFLLGRLRRRGESKEEEGALEKNRTKQNRMERKQVDKVRAEQRQADLARAEQRQDGIERRGRGVSAQGTDELMGDDSAEGMGSGRTGSRRSVIGEKKIALGWSIGSPASGEVSYFHDGTGRGAMIVPLQGMVYAPVAGKIVRLYPTGNAMRLRTDYGIELLIQAGIRTAELEGRYYRPRIVQNEIVNKGKLLLEYDIEGLRQEGYDPAILISVEDAQNYEDVTVYDVENVKVGENLMWVRR